MVALWRRAGGGGRAARAVLALLVLAALLARPLPARLSAELHLPARSPSDVAHALADFSNQPDVSSWRVEADRSNYTTWSYSVAFECGARCGGRAAVWAHDEHDEHAPRHGHARRHRVHVARWQCVSLPLLPWPQLCDEVEVMSLVWGSASEGARLRQQWRSRCGALGWLGGACARGLRARHERGLRALL